MPDITVIIINHGDRATLACALASLTTQRVPFSVVLVADGPDQRLGEIVERFPELDVTRIEHRERLGRGASRQHALESVQTPWLTFLDADDWYLPQKLSRQCEFLRAHPGVDLVSTALYLTGARLREPLVRRFSVAIGERTRASVPFAPSLIRRENAISVGFDERAMIGEDRAFLHGILADCSAAVLAEPLYVYRAFRARSVREELELRRAHVRDAGANDAGLIVAAAREALAGLGSQLAQRAGISRARLDRSAERPSVSERQAFDAARAQIAQICAARGFAEVAREEARRGR